MKEDLHLYGDQLNYFTTTFNVAYCIMLIPSQIILTWVRPSFWLSGLEVAWGVMTGTCPAKLLENRDGFFARIQDSLLRTGFMTCDTSANHAYAGLMAMVTSAKQVYIIRVFLVCCK